MNTPDVARSGISGWFLDRARDFRDFWFRPADPIVLGFIRACTGLVLISILLCSGPLLSSFYGPDAWIDHKTGRMLYRQMPWTPPATGWPQGDGEDAPRPNYPEMANHPDAPDMVKNWRTDPRTTIDLGQPIFSPFYHLTTRTQLVVAHALALLIAGLFTLGVGTRVTSVLAWVVGLSYVHRVQAAMFGMDTMLGILLLYLMIGPSGAALSVDRLVANWRRSRLGLPPVEPEPSAGANLAIRLLQIHFCIIYFISGTSKMQGPAWWNGTAIWQTLTNYEFAPARFETFTAMLRLLTVNRWVWEIVHTAGAWSTLALEVSLPFLIWNRKWRWLMIIGAVGLHTFIALTMGLTAFSLLMICIVFAFIPPESLHWALGVARRLSGRLTARAAPRPEPVREAAAV